MFSLRKSSMFRSVGLVSRAMAGISAVLAAGLLLGVPMGCSGGGSGGPVTVPLSYTPEHARDAIRSYPGSVPAARIYIGNIEDKRDRKDAIGENTESGSPIAIHSPSSPADFVRQTLATQLQRAGLHVVSDPAGADRTLTGDLTHFWVIESNNYEAQIDVKLRLTDGSGAVKWESAESGRGQTFGRSLNAENYRQAISDAMVRLTYENLLTNSEFQAALKNADAGPATVPISR
ncbi:MAG TPA: hypothetical protein VFC78_00225 [Tepidisphaeraceae bacterium]|nr:hypothetical protein [Tepidisphaeraceae bacterium]